MISKYIVSVFDGLPKRLEGYNYLATDTVYIPHLKTDLSITKRTTQGISVIEEYILKFIGAGLEHVDNLCGVMGLDREFIEITIADLYRKDYIIYSASKCNITSKGQSVLESMSETKNEIDILNGICLNLVTGDVDKEIKGLIKECPLHKYKLSTRIELNEYLTMFKRNLPFLKQLFQERVSEVGTKSDQELVNVISLSYDRVWFFPLKINIYVSHDNESLDILPFNSSNRPLLEKIKSIIIDDIMRGKLLTDIIKRGYAHDDKVLHELAILSVNDKLMSEIRNSIQNRGEIETEGFIFDILSQRKLFQNEIIPLLKLLFSEKRIAKLIISGDLKRKTNIPEVISIIQVLCDHDLTIEYGHSRDINKDVSTLKNSIPSINKGMFICKSNIICDLAIQIGEDYTIFRQTKKTSICNGLIATQDEFYLTAMNFTDLYSIIR